MKTMVEEEESQRTKTKDVEDDVFVVRLKVEV